MLKQTATDNYINIQPDISTDQQYQRRTDDGCLKRQQLDRENAELKAKCDFLKYQKLSQDKASMHERRVFNARIKYWRRLNENKDTSTKHVRQMATNVKRVFGAGQVKCWQKGKSAVCWSNEDILYSLELRTVSRKAYVYLRNTKHFPLPGISTLKRWVSGYRCRLGIST